MMRKVFILFVFIFLFNHAQSQYSMDSFELKEEGGYDEISSLFYTIFGDHIGTVKYPLPVVNYLNCTDICGAKQLQIHTMEGELVYRSYHTSENINLANIPSELYMLSVFFENGERRNVYLQRMDIND